MKSMRGILLCVLFALCMPVAADQDNSIYQARVPLMTQHAKAATLDMYRGHPVMISMFYGSCPDVCPMLIMGMQTYEKQLDPRSRKNLRGLVISFDAARDTPSQLQAISTMHHADEKRWTFASADEIDARKLAALLGIQYRRKPDGTFDHSVLITLLDAEGRIVASTSKLNGDEQFLAMLRRQTSR
ncbi:MAG: SCO family protein [Solimonas sp.]